MSQIVVDAALSSPELQFCNSPSPEPSNVPKKTGPDKFTIVEELILSSLFIGKREIYVENYIKLVNGISIPQRLAEEWSEVLRKGCRKNFDPRQIRRKVDSLDQVMKQNEKEKNFPFPPVFDKVANKTFRCHVCKEDSISPGYLSDHVRTERVEEGRAIFTVTPGNKKKSGRKRQQMEAQGNVVEMQHSGPSFQASGEGKPALSPPLGQMPAFPPGSYETPITTRQFNPAQMCFDFGQQMPHPGAMPPPQMDPMMNPWMMTPMALQAMQQAMQHLPLPPSWPSTPQSLQSTPGSNDSGISLPDNSPETSNSRDNEEIYKVQGRLSLNNNSRQHSVSRAEVARRLQSPECMNSSTLASLFRRAKVQGGGEVMRRELQQKGLDLAPENRRRKHAETTCFSALTEDESILMARELNKITHSTYPVTPIVQQMVAQAEDYQELATEAHYAACFIRRMMNIVNQVQISVQKLSFPEINDPLNNQMRVFSALTHGFGLVDQKTWMEVIAATADLAKGTMNARNGVPM